MVTLTVELVLGWLVFTFYKQRDTRRRRFAPSTKSPAGGQAEGALQHRGVCTPRGSASRLAACAHARETLFLRMLASFPLVPYLSTNVHLKKVKW